MRTIETENYLKIAGKNKPGVRDGTGPYKGSYQKKQVGKGKRKQRGEECPAEEKEKK